MMSEARLTKGVSASIRAEACLDKALHAKTANELRTVLPNRIGIVITEVPYQVD